MSRYPGTLASYVPRAAAWTIASRVLAVVVLLVAAVLSWRFAAAVWFLGTLAILVLVAIAVNALREFRA
ncbi:MAG: hypothetical protein INH10_15640 [Rhodocyclaceae bacterium]|jgi:hypothetical protein|nr:hypothetical protein [Rhodocyclaceae bacterium]